jgi:hypothetical protein
MDVGWHMRLLFSAFCLVSIASCSANGEGNSASEQPGPFLSYDITAGLRCEPASGLLGCLRAHERVDARATGRGATRRGERLCLPIQPGPTCFVDGDGLGYTLLDREGDHYLVVETDATGGYTVILMDASDGSQRRVDNRPLHSSHSNLFATVSYDTDAGYIPNRVVVWDAARSAPVFEFDDFAPGEGPTGIRWLGPSKLEVRYSREPYSPGQDGADTFLVWKDGQGVWKNDYKR